MTALSLKTSGKWILCGEHAVLRGSPAIAFPVKSQFFSIEYIKSDREFSVSPLNNSLPELPHIAPFERALDKGLSMLGKTRRDLSGTITATANITLGAGLGGSATLCVTVGRLFLQLGWLDSSELFTFCRGLEDVFHGKSSGLDVAVILADQGIHFKMSGEYHLIKSTWQPNWYLSYSGVSSQTSADVEKVKTLVANNPELAAEIDDDMISSAALAEPALNLKQDEGLPVLAEAINLAASCFKRWELPPTKMVSQMEKISAAGALAVKPTGSGGGGFILSLWPEGVVPAVSGIEFYRA